MNERLMQVCVSYQVWRAISELRESFRIMTAFDFDIRRAIVDEDKRMITAWCGCYDPCGDDAELETTGPFLMYSPDEEREMPYWQTRPMRIEDIRGLSPEDVAKYLQDSGMRPRYRGTAAENLGMVIGDQEYSDFALLGRLCLDACWQNAELAAGARLQTSAWDWDLTFTPRLTAALIKQRATLGKCARYCANGSNSKTLNFAMIFGWLKDLADIAHAMETP